MTIYYFDLIGGNNANDGLSFANRKQFPVNQTDMAAGTEYRIMKTPDPVDLGISVTWPSQVFGSVTTAGGYRFTVTGLSTLIKNIWVTTDTAMSGVTNMTVTRDTTVAKRPPGTNAASTKIVCSSAFTTGKMAYYYFGGTSRDYSGFNGLTFWIRTTVALAANTLRFDLCSDNLGYTPVYSFTLDKAITLTSAWCPITIPYGSALGNTAINSFAITALTDPGTATINIAGICACYTDKLNYSNVVGANTTDYPFWYMVSELDANTNTVYLNNDSANNGEGNYYTYTGNLFCKQTADLLKSALSFTNATTAFVYPPNSSSNSTENSPVTISGGWNETDMSTQTGDTAINFSYLIVNNGPQIIRDTLINSYTYHAVVDRLTIVGGYAVIGVSNCASFKVTNVNFVDNYNVFRSNQSVPYAVRSKTIMENCNFAYSINQATITGVSDSRLTHFKNCKFSRITAGYSISPVSSEISVDGVIHYSPTGSTYGYTGCINLSQSVPTKSVIKNLTSYGGYGTIYLPPYSDMYMSNSSFINPHFDRGIRHAADNRGVSFFDSCTINHTEFTKNFNTGYASIIFKNCNSTNNTTIYKIFGKIETDTAIKYGSNTFSWGVTISDQYGLGSYYAMPEQNDVLPVASHKLGAIPVVAGKLVTTTLRVKLATASRGKVGLAAGRGEIFDTYPSNVWCDNSTTDWQVITHTCTPARDGIFEPHVCFAFLVGSTSMNFCDFTCTQAD